MTAQGALRVHAEAVWLSRSNDIRIPVKDDDAGPPTHQAPALGIWWSSRKI